MGIAHSTAKAEQRQSDVYPSPLRGALQRLHTSQRRQRLPRQGSSNTEEHPHCTKRRQRSTRADGLTSLMFPRRRGALAPISNQDIDSVMIDTNEAGPSRDVVPSSRRRRTRSMAHSDGEEDKIANGERLPTARRTRQRTHNSADGVVGSLNSRTLAEEVSAAPNDSPPHSRVQQDEVPAEAEAATDNAQPVASASALNDEQRRSRVRTQLAQAIFTNSTANRAAAAQHAQAEAGARPSMLSAMLSDILNLRGGGQGGANAPNASRPPQGQPAPSRSVSSGGTSVIVQGALVSRTVPERTTQGSDGDEAGTSASREQTGLASDEEGQTSAGGTETGGAADASDVQAATIEEQATMLVRLLSIATAATAASLLQASAGRNAALATATAATAALNSVSAARHTSPVSPNHAVDLVPEEVPAELRSAASARPESTSSSSSSSASLAWASQTLQSLRSRMSSIGSRIRGRRATMSDSDRLQNRSPMASARRGSMRGSQSAASHSVSTPQNPPTSDLPRVNVAGTDVAGALPTGSPPALATLSNMLRDAIRDGIQGTRSRQASNTAPLPARPLPQPTPPQTASSADDATSAQIRIQAVNATLDAVREGHLAPGDEGSFNRFLYDLSNDLNVAVQGLPGSSTQFTTRAEAPDPPSAAGLSSSGTTAALDEGTRLRRQRDTQDGQLSFFRFFTFPELDQAYAPTDRDRANNAPGLLPCIVVGVRSLGRGSEAPATAQAAAAQPARHGHGESPLVQTETSIADANATEQRPRADQSTMMHVDLPAAGPRASEGGAEAVLRGEAGPPSMSRYLLFVSGGHYPAQHPLFHATNEEASRDLMVLMEVLGAMASVQPKMPQTVTRDEIARSALRTVNGTRTEVETLARLRQVMENTSERCLICLEDWLDEAEQRRLLDCGHLFHAPCLDTWLTASSNSCPLCRRQAVAKGDGADASAHSAADAIF